MNNSLKFNAPLFFIGIGGSGMRPLACSAKHFGYEVFGSDSNISTRNIEGFKKLGIRVFDDQDEKNLRGIKSVIISSAIPEHNVELRHARKLGIPVYHRSEFLHKLSKDKNQIAISGTHGKTTSSSILTYLLDRLGFDPNAILGGEMVYNNSSFRTGSGEHFIIEADESDGSFLNYRPSISLLTNIDVDHLDHYQNENNLNLAFNQFLNNTKPEGSKVVGVNNQKEDMFFQNLCPPKLSFGTLKNCDLFINSIKQLEGFQSFKIHWKKKTYPVQLSSLGKHNALNCTGALACLLTMGIPLEKAIPYLKDFPGTSRRLTIIYDQENTSIIDDYAHNPGKIRASIEATRSSWPKCDLTVIFEPHRYSRIATLYDSFTESFKYAQRVFVAPIFSAGEKINPLISVSTLSEEIQKRSKAETFIYKNPEQVFKIRNLSAKHVILVVGAGDSSKISLKLKRFLIDQRPPKTKEVLAFRSTATKEVSLEI